MTARSRRCGRDHPRRRARRGAPAPNGAAPTDADAVAAAEHAAEGLLDGAAAVDAIGVGDVGEDAAEVVRRLAARSVAAPEDADGATGGVWARWKQRTTQGAPIFPLAVLFGLNMVDELDRTAFGVLLPEIRDHFGLDNSGILTVVSLSLIAALILALPIGFYGDRWRRVPIAGAGAAVWGVFSALTAAAGSVLMLGAARAGAGLGRAVNDPTHNSLLADYYDIPARPRVYAVHRYANALGQFLGPLLGGLIAYTIGWRAPFLVFAVITGVFVVLTFRLHEPIRGHHERKAMGASAEVANTEEQPPSWAESWRIVWQVRTLRRLYVALPFVAVAIVGLLTLSGLYYEEIFELDERARGFTSAGLEGAAQLVGLMFGIPLTTRLMAKGPGNVVRFLGKVSFGIAAAWVAFALSPTLPVAIAFNAVLSAGFFLLLPGIFVTLSLTVPAKVRSFGFAVATLFILPGLVVLPFIGWLADEHGIRVGLVAAAPVFIVGGLIIASAGALVEHDIAQVWRSTAARSEVAHLRKQGKVKLLLGRQIDVHYDRRAGALRGRLRGRRGRDRGPDGHQRRRQVDAAQGHRRPRAGLGGGDRVRRSGHDPHAARRGRRSRGLGRAGRSGRVHAAERGRQPASRGVGQEASRRRRGGGHPAGPRHVPDPARSARRAGRQPVGRPAADADARHGLHRQATAADDRRAVARPGALGGQPAPRGSSASCATAARP